jgi:hypothetical protein
VISIRSSEREEAAEKWPRRLFTKNTGLCKVKKTTYRD